eukprot:220842_1
MTLVHTLLKIGLKKKTFRMSHVRRQTIQRLEKELSILSQNTDTNLTFHTTSIDSNIFHWTATINVPSSKSKHSPFEDGTYTLDIQIPDNYPVRPPQVKFVTPMFHPNIDKNGKIDILIFRGGWSPVLTIKRVLLTVLAVLHKPIHIENYLEQIKIKNNDMLKKPCGHNRYRSIVNFKFNEDCVRLYNRNRLLYEEMANDCAVTYANATKQYNLYDTFNAIKQLLLLGFGSNGWFDVEIVVIIYVGIDIIKLNKWSKDLQLDNDMRYKRLLNQKRYININTQVLVIECVCLTGKIIEISVPNNGMIKCIKERIHDNEGIPTDRFLISFKGYVLEDDDIIDHCGIEHRSKVYMLLEYESKCSSVSMVAVRCIHDNDSIRSQRSYTGFHSTSSHVDQSRHNPMSN